ncbi:hypothetical protein ACWCQZ_42910 [Streptomyces sp. NPDC002285]
MTSKQTTDQPARRTTASAHRPCFQADQTRMYDLGAAGLSG